MQQLTWWPADNGFEIARDGSTLLCRDWNDKPVTPVPDAVHATRSYPAWALVNRPTEAAAAVAADTDMVAARGLKSYDLAQRFERIARELPTPHQPVFYERAARVLAQRGDRKRAATLFGQARAVEIAWGLPIADDVWLDLHREFAALGALSTKTIGDFVKGLKNRATPEAAVSALTEVAVLRARAGQAPWPQLPKQLSAFAKAARLDKVSAHEDLLTQLLEAEALRESAAALWTAWQPILVQVCRRSPRVRGLLLNLLPVPESLDGWWLDLLDECGATAGLIDMAEPGAEPVGGRAAWLARTVHHPNRDDVLRHRSRISRLLPAQLSDLIVRMAPALRRDGVPVRLDGPDYWTKYVDPRVLEACLANGVPVADWGPDAGLDLNLWLRGRRPEDDLTAAVQDPRFAPAIRSWAEKGDATRLWAIPALRPFLTQPEAAEAVHPLDGPKIYSAVHDFGAVGASSGLAAPRLLYSLRLLTHALREGTAGSTDPNLLRLGETATLAGRLEWVVLRAIAPSTPADRRELLTAFLEVWGESVLADPATRVFHGTADFDREFAADEHGVAMGTRYARENPRPFMALTNGSVPGAEPPSLGRINAVTELPVGWGTRERLRRLVALLREQGGVAHDPAAAAALAEGTGLNRFAAEMALAGLIGVTSYNVPFVSSGERKALGITAKQIEAGQFELAAIRGEERLDLLLGVLPDDPAELWQPGGTVALAQRIAAAWPTRFDSGAGEGLASADNALSSFGR